MGSRFRGNDGWGEDDKERRRVFGPAALLFWSMERRGVTLTPPPLDTGFRRYDGDPSAAAVFGAAAAVCVCSACLGAVPAGCIRLASSKSLLATLVARSPGRQVPSAKSLPARNRCVRVSAAFDNPASDASQIVHMQPDPLRLSMSPIVPGMSPLSEFPCSGTGTAGCPGRSCPESSPLSELSLRFRAVTLVGMLATGI